MCFFPFNNCYVLCTIHHSNRVPIELMKSSWWLGRCFRHTCTTKTSWNFPRIYIDPVWCFRPWTTLKRKQLGEVRRGTGTMWTHPITRGLEKESQWYGGWCSQKRKCQTWSWLFTGATFIQNDLLNSASCSTFFHRKWSLRSQSRQRWRESRWGPPMARCSSCCCCCCSLWQRRGQSWTSMMVYSDYCNVQLWTTVCSMMRSSVMVNMFMLVGYTFKQLAERTCWVEQWCSLGWLCFCCVSNRIVHKWRFPCHVSKFKSWRNHGPGDSDHSLRAFQLQQANDGWFTSAGDELMIVDDCFLSILRKPNAHCLWEFRGHCVSRIGLEWTTLGVANISRMSTSKIIKGRKLYWTNDWFISGLVSISDLPQFWRRIMNFNQLVVIRTLHPWHFLSLPEGKQWFFFFLISLQGTQLECGNRGDSDREIWPWLLPYKEPFSSEMFQS